MLPLHGPATLLGGRRSCLMQRGKYGTREMAGNLQEQDSGRARYVSRRAPRRASREGRLGLPFRDSTRTNIQTKLSRPNLALPEKTEKVELYLFSCIININIMTIIIYLFILKAAISIAVCQVPQPQQVFSRSSKRISCALTERHDVGKSANEQENTKKYRNK